MSDMQILIKQALEAGFSQAGELNVKSLEFMPEVREMCAADKCNSYDKNWMCPPACGSLEDAVKKTERYTRGIIVQTIGKLEDEFDWETIQETSKKHKITFEQFTEVLRKNHPDILPMGAGACTICDECTFPKEPCRFPDKAVSSMEAYGLFVSKVCTLSEVPYNNGQNTITFTSCYLIE